MNRYEEGVKIIEERCGNGIDNLISVATIAVEPAEDGSPRPYTREVDAHYEDGVFYSVTWGKSAKIEQIGVNNRAAFTVCSKWITGSGTAENLGWVLKPENAEIRAKLRKTFAEWYDFANDESNENCVIMAVRIKNAIVVVDHGVDRFYLDFVNKTEGEIPPR